MHVSGKKFTATDILHRYTISRRTLGMWLTYPDMDFPRPVCIRNRLYFDRAEIEEFDRRHTRPKAA